MLTVGLRTVIAGLGCASSIALAAPAAAAISIGFGFESNASASLLSETTQEVTIRELSNRGTLTEANADGVAFWSLNQPVSIMERGQEIARIDSWDIELKEDPYVLNNVNVTNTSAFTQAFILSVVMPIPAYGYDRVINSSLGVTATDNNANNVLQVALAGAPFYQGRVDNVTKLALDPPGMPLDTADCSPFPSTPGCSAQTSAGISSLAVTPAIAHEIQIILRFALSTGDAVGVTSRFEIVSSTAQIPEPGTASLLVVGLALIASLRRR